MRFIPVSNKIAIGIIVLSSFCYMLKAQLKPLTESEVEQLKTFKSIEEAMQSPEEVEAFFMNYAKLNEIPKEIANFTQLIVLGFGGNSISEIPDFIFDLKKLQRLGFSHNKISKIPEGVSRLTNLTSFKCWNNQITEVPEALLNLPNIQAIELKGNPIPKEEKSRLKKAYPTIKFVF